MEVSRKGGTRGVHRLARVQNWTDKKKLHRQTEWVPEFKQDQISASLYFLHKAIVGLVCLI